MSEVTEFLNLGRLNAPYAERLKQAAARVIDSGRYLHGPETKALEAELGAMHGERAADGSLTPRHCVAVSNGLDALRLMLRAYIELGQLAPGDEVIVPANTYIATVLAITDAGLRPVLVEPEPVTMNLDPQAARRAITPRTRAIMAVHLYGIPTLPQVAGVAREHGLLLLEDNAQSIGARADGRLTGTFGHAAALSFYPTKNLGALGDAGALLTADADLAATVRALANYGSDRRYHNVYQGFNCRMDELQAALLRVRLEGLSEDTERRRAAARAYCRAIDNQAVTAPAVPAGMEPVWHQFVVRSPRRDALREYLAAHGVQTDIHYGVPPHLQPCYAALEHGPLPLTEQLAGEVLSLPIAHVTEADAHDIALIINKF